MVYYFCNLNNIFVKTGVNTSAGAQPSKSSAAANNPSSFNSGQEEILNVNVKQFKRQEIFFKCIHRKYEKIKYVKNLLKLFENI